MNRNSRLLIECILINFGVFTFVLIVPAIIFAVRAGLFFFLFGFINRQERYNSLAKFTMKTDIFGIWSSEEAVIQSGKTASAISMVVGILIIIWGLVKDYLVINNPAHLLICVFILMNLTALALNGYLKKKASFQYLNNKIYRIGFIGGCIANVLFALWALDRIPWN